jgi:sulfhydrogenase subunit alpha
LHSHTKDGGHYLVGPLARLNLNHAQLMPLAQKALQDNQIRLPITNPYQSLVARVIELVHFFEEAIQLIHSYDPAGPAHLELKLKAGEGAGASEAPRGLLYHRYKLDDQGRVQFARIVPPTAQNLPRIEEDLFALAPQLVEMPQEQATLTAEHLVRAYDPCISCATHFLKLKIESRD